jgi:hypothetical protein
VLIEHEQIWKNSSTMLTTAIRRFDIRQEYVTGVGSSQSTENLFRIICFAGWRSRLSVLAITQRQGLIGIDVGDVLAPKQTNSRTTATWNGVCTTNNQKPGALSEVSSLTSTEVGDD